MLSLFAHLGQSKDQQWLSFSNTMSDAVIDWSRSIGQQHHWRLLGLTDPIRRRSAAPRSNGGIDRICLCRCRSDAGTDQIRRCSTTSRSVAGTDSVHRRRGAIPQLDMLGPRKSAIACSTSSDAGSLEPSESAITTQHQKCWDWAKSAIARPHLGRMLGPIRPSLLCTP